MEYLFIQRPGDKEEILELLNNFKEYSKEELIEDEEINSEPAYFREYLKGCNSGIVDALCIIKNFGVEE